ncbi:MAG: YfcE family phosphodiesterase [Desulfobulbaceae bacterium]|nr:YfcE family phosphodiesterase [Desulfobulbaceae bacterium]
MITIGILSDTHIQTASDAFTQNCQIAFSDCNVIIHAGDLTDSSILSVFKGKEVHAVYGNSCNRSTQISLPREKLISLGGFTIGISHGAGSRHNIEERVFDLFPEADCIVYGHSHIPVCHTVGGTLMMNPGSFQGTGPYGAAGSYGIIKIDQHGLQGSLHTISTL